MRMVVVLPVPLGPINANTEPSGTLQAQVFDGFEAAEAFGDVMGLNDHSSTDGLEAAKIGPGVLHRLLHFVEARTHAHGFHHELFHFIFEQALAIAGARFRRRGNQGSHAWLHRQPAFLDQVLHHLVGGVRMDLEVQRQRAHGRERLHRPSVRRPGWT